MEGLYDDEKMTAAEDSITSRTAFSSLFPYFVAHRRELLICLLLLLLATAASVAWPIVMQQVLDKALPNGDARALILSVIAIGVLQVVVLLLLYYQRIKLEVVGQAVILGLRQKLFGHLLSLDTDYFNKHPVGRLMSRVESDTEALRLLFTNTAVILVGDFLLVIGIGIAMFIYNWQLTLILATFIPVMVLMTIYYERKTTPTWLKIRKNMATVTATLSEFLHGMAIVQIFNRGDYARRRMYEASEIKFRNDAFAHISVTAFFNVIHFMEYVMVGVLLYFAGQWIAAGTLTVGVFSLFMIFIWKAMEPLYRASEQLSHIQRAISGAKRIYALQKEQSILADAPTPKRLARIRQGIRFENVWFSYTNDENWVLKDVSFEVPVGARVALAGVTGGGKSTVISLLFRLYDPQKGRITIDCIDLRDMDKEELRGHFAMVLQDIFLFPDTVRANIALSANGVSDAAVESAARTVEAHRFIERLPEGYNTQVSEKGANFSRGERQLLSFARALVRDPEVLLLDEATSSVDPATERTIQASLNRLMAGRTAIIIAHRLSTILDADTILVIRHGEIVERGTHAELLLANGYYSRLFHLQFKHLTESEAVNA